WFFFSSRRRHTRSDRDWSSDVCSSDLRFLECLLPVAAETPDHGALSFVDALHAHRHRAVVDAVISCAPREIGDTRARHHGLGGRAADVDASAADVLAFDDCGLPACAPERDGKRLAGLARADDDGVVGGVVHLAPSGNGEIHLTRTPRFGQYNSAMRFAAVFPVAALFVATAAAQDAQLIEQAKRRWAESPHGQMLERILPPTFELH